MDLQVRQHKSLRYIVSVPLRGNKPWPVLCFLPGFDEYARDEDQEKDTNSALKKHGPLRTGNPLQVAERFIVVAIQLPRKPEPCTWGEDYAKEVREIMEEVQMKDGGTPAQFYLTGFSIGGNGALAIGAEQSDFWAAIWAVDPPHPACVRNGKPHPPVWLSIGPLSRRMRQQFQNILDVDGQETVYADRGLSDTNKKPEEPSAHVMTARYAYQDDLVYDWLRSKHR